MNSDEPTNVRATLILEVVGRPPEHLVETLEKLLKTLSEEKGVTIKNKKINDPTPMKDQKEFFTTFAEVEVEVEEILQLVFLMFKYMPAHVDIISPENIKLTNDGLNGVLNELIRRLHGYDEIARVVQVEKNILETKLKTILGKIKEAKERSDKKKADKKKE